MSNRLETKHNRSAQIGRAIICNVADLYGEHHGRLAMAVQRPELSDAQSSDLFDLVGDVIADLLHFADAAGLDSSLVVECAMQHHATEYADHVQGEPAYNAGEPTPRPGRDPVYGFFGNDHHGRDAWRVVWAPEGAGTMAAEGVAEKLSDALRALALKVEAPIVGEDIPY